MKRLNVILILLCIIINMMNAQNPFFEKYTTPYGTVPFDKIKTEHYEPAIREGIRQQAAEIDAIVNNHRLLPIQYWHTKSQANYWIV